MHAAANEKAPASNLLYSRYRAAKYTVSNPRPMISVARYGSIRPPLRHALHMETTTALDEVTRTPVNVMAINPDPLAHYDIR